jgi:hypothetical protein
MSQFIESMESRTLFTASAGVILADLEAIKSAVVTAKADLKASLTQATADVKSLKAAVAAAKPTASQKATLTTLQADELKGAVKSKAQVTAILASGTHDGLHLLAVLESLRAHPTSTVIQAKVEVALAALQGAFSNTVVTTVEGDASTIVTTLNTDLNAVATAIPSTQSDVTTFEGHLATDLTTLSTQATAIQSAIAVLAGNLA